MSSAGTLKIPRHLALIPDGNRRWARLRGLSIREGHQEGYQNLKEIARLAMDMGVEAVSIYGFSTENWKRSKEEVGFLMGLMRWVARHEIKNIDEENMRVRFSGSEDGLDKGIVKALRSAERRTEGNDRGQLVLCINYSGQQEMVDVTQAIVDEAVAAAVAGEEKVTVDRQTITDHLYVPDLPPVDLLIRTSGEQRTSDFLPWQAAYAELMFSDRLWPDFKPEDLVACFEEFGDRERRFGG